MHDEVCVGCLMIIAHPPRTTAPEPPTSAAAAEEPAGAWAARTLRRTRAYAEDALRLSWRGSWKVGGDRYAKPDPDERGVSGYNMGCASLPNRVEHCENARPPAPAPWACPWGIQGSFWSRFDEANLCSHRQIFDGFYISGGSPGSRMGRIAFS